MSQIRGLPRPFRRRRYWPVVGAVLAVWLLAAEPVLADAFSARVWFAALTPAGQPYTDYCLRSGIVSTARDYGQINSYNNGGGAHDCAGPVTALPNGYIGVAVEGFMNGASCGQPSMFFYNTAPADNWQLYDTRCSNPPGTQNFQSLSYGSIYDGTRYFGPYSGPMSPSQPY